MIDRIDSPQDIQNSLLDWFSKHGRHWIPWKLNRDGSIAKSGESISPYEIWIAEVMLQQTQLKVVIPYWERWMKIFPSLTYLAEADFRIFFLCGRALAIIHVQIEYINLLKD